MNGEHCGLRIFINSFVAGNTLLCSRIFETATYVDHCVCNTENAFLKDLLEILLETVNTSSMYDCCKVS